MGAVSLIADGVWHRYVLAFPTDVVSGAPLLFGVVSSVVGPVQPVVFDSLKLVARPFETVSLISNNGFVGRSWCQQRWVVCGLLMRLRRSRQQISARTALIVNRSFDGTENGRYDLPLVNEQRR